MRHLDAMLWILTETHYIVNGPSKPDLNETQGQDHEGTILRMGRKCHLVKVS